MKVIVAAVRHSQISQPAPDVTESEVPASASEPDGDSSGKETAHVSDLFRYDTHCVVVRKIPH